MRSHYSVSEQPGTENPSGSPKITILEEQPPTEQPLPEAKNFEVLAAKVVQVPKHEIDEQRRKS